MGKSNSKNKKPVNGSLPMEEEICRDTAAKGRRRNMEPVKVNLPYEQPSWKKAAAILEKLSTFKDTEYMKFLEKLVQVFSAYWKVDFKLKDTPFIALKSFFENSVSKEEQTEYLTKSFPKMAELALKAQNHEPVGGLFYSVPNCDVTVKLDRNYVAGLVAMGFLCFYRLDPPKFLHGYLTSLNFDNFLQMGFFTMNVKSQVSKLKCILNYFSRLCDLGESIPGEVTFHRVHLASDVPTVARLAASDRKLCRFTVEHMNTIEDSGCETLQVDFANEYIGGGVLGGGNVQEEIRFSLCPELLASMLFMARMEPTEAIVMQGFEQFSRYKGYGGSFSYDGNYDDKSCRSAADGNIATTIVAIDAIPYGRNRQEQYQMNHIKRDIIKAYVGFLQPYDDASRNGEGKRVVATGNWGCGAFGGDPQLKSLLQWIAGSEAECPGLIYYTFRDQHVMYLDRVVRKIVEANWKVKDLYDCVATYYNKVKGKVSVFDYIEETLSGCKAKGGTPESAEQSVRQNEGTPESVGHSVRQKSATPESAEQSVRQKGVTSESAEQSVRQKGVNSEYAEQSVRQKGVDLEYVGQSMMLREATQGSAKPKVGDLKCVEQSVHQGATENLRNSPLRQTGVTLESADQSVNPKEARRTPESAEQSVKQGATPKPAELSVNPGVTLESTSL